MEKSIAFNEPAEGEATEEEYSGGGDVWRYDDTVLNELEDFLGRIDQGDTEEPPKEEDAAVRKLLDEVQQELSEAKAEIAKLKEENDRFSRRLDCGSLGDDEEYLEMYQKAFDARRLSQRLWQDLKDTYAELAEDKLTLYKVPDSQHADKPAVPSKYGQLKLNKMTLDVHLVGGETLELINKSKEGHQHVSKLDLTFIDQVGVVKDNDCAFKVKSANGAYVMTASNPSEAKSWARAIDVSIRVARAKKNKK